jgi:hypothetical protein
VLRVTRGERVDVATLMEAVEEVRGVRTTAALPLGEPVDPTADGDSPEPGDPAGESDAADAPASREDSDGAPASEARPDATPREHA